MEGQPPASAMPSPAGASKPAAAAPAPGAKPARKNNLRHIIVVALLGVLALGVSGAIIYFTLHVTGVIENITQNSSTTLTPEEQAAENFANELAVLRDRVRALEEDPSTEDETLETDLQDFLGHTIQDYGKDSNETLQVTLLVAEYYDFMAQYDVAKDYLEDRLSVLDDETTKSGYITELYRLASKNGDTDTASYYLDQLNNNINNESDNEQKAQLAYDLSLSLYLSYIDKEYIDDDAVKQQMFDAAYQAEELHPTGDTAALIGYIEKQFGDCDKGNEYLGIAAERDPENYKIGDGEDDVS